LALCAATGAAQAEKRPPEVVMLSPVSEKLLAVPMFGADANAQCDAAGNLYFHATRKPDASAVLKVLTDGTFSTYTPSADDAADTWYLAFRVWPDGKLWLLAHGSKSGVFLFEFGQNATVSPTRTRLDVPDVVEVRNFVVLQEGHVLLQGFYNPDAPKERRGRGYFAEFDASGRLLRETGGKPLPGDLLKDMTSRTADAAAAQGEDGLIYMLVNNDVLVISQAGEVVRKFSVKSADAYTPSNLFLGGGRLAVVYFRPEGQPAGPLKVALRLKVRYALYDPSNGEQFGVYEPGSETGSGLVCYSSDGFTLMRPKNGRLQLITAKP